MQYGCFKICGPNMEMLPTPLLFYLMDIQTHRNSTQKALILGAFFQQLKR